MYEVRRATPGDAPAISALVQEAHAEHAAGEPGIFQPAEQLVLPPADAEALLRETAQLWWVGTAPDGEVIGYLHAEDQRIPASRYKLGARRLHVIAMTVSAIARRQGVGRAMLAAARAEAIARSASEVTLEVYAFNTPARRLYEAEGFRPIRELLSSAVPAEHSGDPSTRTGRRG